MKRNFVKNLFFIINQSVAAGQIIFSRASLSRKLNELDMIKADKNFLLNRSFKRLEEQNLIKAVNKKGDNYYRLTEKGIKKLAEFNLKNRSRSGDEEWDGFWRVVIFDIPEDKKIVRDALRRRLKYLDFYPLQKSVFVTPFSCEKEIADLASFFQVDKYLDTLLVKSIGREEKEVCHFFRRVL